MYSAKTYFLILSVCVCVNGMRQIIESMQHGVHKKVE